MTRKILIIDGHPDPGRGRFIHGLADAYAQGAHAAGHQVRRIEVATLDLPMIRTRKQWEGPACYEVESLQDDIRWASHIVILYPLWLGDMPAVLKGFFEQVFRPGFAVAADGKHGPGLLKGRSAHIVVTMGMPAIFYRFFYGAHSVKSLERNILKLVGIGPVTHTLIGSVESDTDRRALWLQEMFGLGEAGRVPALA